jgi:outer membrane protein assembly factor BamE
MRQLRRSSFARIPGRMLQARAVRAAAALAATLALAACSSLEQGRWTSVFLPYRIEVVQGNVVTSEQLARVGKGMSRQQVRDVLGSPLLTDMFHANRWDYIFMLTRQGTPSKRLDVQIFFQDDAVARVEAPDLPTNAEFIESIAPNLGSRGVPVLALSPEQIKALPVPPPPPVAAASAVAAPQRNYPPLEPRG